MYIMVKSKEIKHEKKIQKKSHKGESREGFHFLKSDFSKENVIEGGVIRPLILMLSFVTFLLGMFLLLLGSQGNASFLKWGGSAIIFSFVLNLQSIYTSLTDEPSFFRTMNLSFKMVLFLFEIMAFNYVLITIL